MQKAEFQTMELSDQQRRERDALIQSLQQDEQIRALLNRRRIPAALLTRQPWQFASWRKDTAVCRSCPGLASCRQKVRGYYPDLCYDGILKPVIAACRYQRKEEQQLAHTANFLVNDLSSDLLKVSFESIDLPNETPSYVSELTQAMQAAKENRGLYLVGPMGSGKTYLAACAVNYQAKLGRHVAFVHYPSFCQRIRLNPETGEYRTEVSRLGFAEFLVLDDIGAENVTAWNRDDILLPVLNERMEHHLPTWFTSNEDFSSLENHFSVTSRGQEEKQKAMRILERIHTLAAPLKILGRDRRKAL